MIARAPRTAGVPAGGRSPAVRRAELERRRRTTLLCAVAGTAVIAGAWWTLTGPPVAISTVRVEGYRGPDRARVNEVVAAVAAEGTMVRPPVQRMREELVARFPQIADVHVAREWPRTVRVQVDLARPGAVLEVRGGRSLLVSPAGRVLGEGARRGLPTIDVPTAPRGDRVGGSAQRSALAFLAALEPSTAARVKDLRLARGALRARLAGGPELRLGPPERPAEKALVLDAVVGNADPADLARATYLDLSVPERPTMGGVGSTAAADDGEDAAPAGDDADPADDGAPSSEP